MLKSSLLCGGQQVCRYLLSRRSYPRGSKLGRMPMFPEAHDIYVDDQIHEASATTMPHGGVISHGERSYYEPSQPSERKQDSFSAWDRSIFSQSHQSRNSARRNPIGQYHDVGPLRQGSDTPHREATPSAYQHGRHSRGGDLFSTSDRFKTRRCLPVSDRNANVRNKLGSHGEPPNEERFSEGKRYHQQWHHRKSDPYFGADGFDRYPHTPNGRPTDGRTDLPRQQYPRLNPFSEAIRNGQFSSQNNAEEQRFKSSPRHYEERQREKDGGHYSFDKKRHVNFSVRRNKSSKDTSNSNTDNRTMTADEFDKMEGRTGAPSPVSSPLASGSASTGRQSATGGWDTQSRKRMVSFLARKAADMYTPAMEPPAAGTTKKFDARVGERNEKTMADVELDTVKGHQFPYLKSLDKEIKTARQNHAVYMDLKAKDSLFMPLTTSPPIDSENKTVSVQKTAVTQFAFRPSTICPSKTCVILFPGFGTHSLGMANGFLSYPGVKSASDLLGFNLLKMCSEGPLSELQKPRHSHAAIFVASLAAIEKLRIEHPEAIENCTAVAGFDLGEISALVFAGALSFHSGLEILRARAETIEERSAQTASGMATLICKTGRQAKALDAARKAVEDDLVRTGSGVCSVAAQLFPCGALIGGHQDALRHLESNAEKLGVLKFKRLPVSGALHTALMRTNAEEDISPYYAALRGANIVEPLIAVHSNVDGYPLGTADDIRKKLFIQLSLPVKWEHTMHVLYKREKDVPYPQTFECGPGGQLGLLLQRNYAKAHANFKWIFS